MVIAYHLILTGYGHWLPNDPRGSMSIELAAGKLYPLGMIHRGRKAKRPTRRELKQFYQDAPEQLEHQILWYDAAKRRVIAEVFAEVVQSRRYTCFACAILSDHAHLVIRKHRDRAETMVAKFRKESATRLRRLADIPNNHPVWSSDQFKKYLDSSADIERTIRYVENNPIKSGLEPQNFYFVKPYRGEWSR